jgi:hypothetical protein
MKIKHIIPLALVVTAGMVGCSKDFLDVNTNPNQLPTTTPEFVFTSGLARTAATIVPNETGQYWSGLWTQSNTYIISGALFQYNFNNTNFNYWDGYYDILNDFQYVITNADEKGMPFLKGPAKVMKAYIFHQLVDLYGNIPYTDALKGLGSLAPKFDDQKAIYDDLIKQLDEAIVDIKANPFTGVYGGSDVTASADLSVPTSNNGGNQTKWVRFANSLKLRLLIRQSKMAGRDSYIITEINKAAASTEGFLAFNTDFGVNPGYVAAAGQTNPWYNYIGYTPTSAAVAYARYPRPTTTLYNYLVGTSDTFRLKRLMYAFGGESTSVPGTSKASEVLTNYKPVPYGISSGYLAQNTSYPGPSIIQRGQFNKHVVLMTAAEVQLLLAEAKQRYGASVTLPLTAKDYYNAGVTASFRLTGATAAYGADKVATLLSNGKDLADFDASTDKLKAIWYQKWIALCGYSGLEAWAEYRRTNFPDVPVSAAAAVGAKKPNRLYYPSTELGSNEANVTAQGTIDVFTSKIFWDVD